MHYCGINDIILIVSIKEKLFILKGSLKMGNVDTSTGSMIQLVIMIVVMVVAFYFVLIRPQSKQQKEEENAVLLSGRERHPAAD